MTLVDKRPQTFLVLTQLFYFYISTKVKFDRHNNYYYVEKLVFPLPDEPNKDISFHNNTIVDGELIEDSYPDGKVHN
ncbi:hypothetical protein AYI69_g123 [Smittium culicis]|uniref:mRNA capping enzyme adenylation domain-containing protein n=1 Tax=Smittium culicis TaxID=133412 RepID=A0A1R1YTU9_9FUNG|nr:hypothetical protein AYI69_g123 [Smittium culicis]